MILPWSVELVGGRSDGHRSCVLSGVREFSVPYPINASTQNTPAEPEFTHDIYTYSHKRSDGYHIFKWADRVK